MLMLCDLMADKGGLGLERIESRQQVTDSSGLSDSVVFYHAAGDFECRKLKCVLLVLMKQGIFTARFPLVDLTSN